MGTGLISQLILIVFLLLLCFLVGLFGKTRRIGFWKASIIAFLFTVFCLITGGDQDISGGSSINSTLLFFAGPIIGFIVCLFYRSNQKQKEEEILRSQHFNKQTTITDELKKLNDLYKNGGLTDEEYQTLKTKLISKLA